MPFGPHSHRWPIRAGTVKGLLRLRQRAKRTAAGPDGLRMIFTPSADLNRVPMCFQINELSLDTVSYEILEGSLDRALRWT